ncbi:MAG: 1-deoxy-D-xylulose-5-phosphate reductoisomerase [Gemmatimonadetes bacterium]|nr:1-deoxy-D-xylulose-5-phosphate reductoisomerase [Gemmatimonadota bacterium]MBI3082110.1 1-deoxy-D-xylulose-5-phosphate reductoisomerase [Gemmatimonadota bacterium]
MSIGVAVLGSTGSIGTAALRVLARQRERFRVVALTAHASADLLERQARETGAPFVGLVQGNAGRNRRWPVGPGCLVEAATHPGIEIVINAIVGAAGLPATLAALRAGKRVALANKETLVMAGELVLCAAREGRGEIVPIDSEHSAVLQCMASAGGRALRRLILTASGGPFREWTPERVARATVAEALNHPTWRMGPKITVDSATLANKALEVIEGHFLFGLPYDGIEVVLHPQSVIHALTEFADGSVLAQLGFPSMELPILYALTHPERLPDDGVRRFDPVAASPLTFEPLAPGRFPTFDLGVAAGRKGGTGAAVFNAANEVAVQAFLAGRVRFGAIGETIDAVLQAHQVQPAKALEDVLAADRWARERAEARCS